MFKSNYSPLHIGKKLNDAFPHYGIIAFCGKQGSGKSLSACQLIVRLKKYYNVCVISNIPINIDYVPYMGLDSLLNLNVNESEYDGFIVFIDEISTLFNSLESKNIDLRWFQLINMLRKRHILMLCTCPVFNRIAKPFREQFEYFVDCNHMGRFQINDVYQSKSVSLFSEEVCNFEYVKTYRFFHKQYMYDFYDTLELIKRGDD